MCSEYFKRLFTRNRENEATDIYTWRLLETFQSETDILQIMVGVLLRFGLMMQSNLTQLKEKKIMGSTQVNYSENCTFGTLHSLVIGGL